MNELEILSLRIKELRESLKMTQKDFSEYVGIKQQTLSGYERGIMKPPLDIAKNISEKCNVSMDWLCGLTDRKSANKIFTTYTDVIDMFFDLMNIGGLNVYPEDKVAVDCKGFERKMWGILFTDKYLKEFLADWKKMRELNINGTIDDEVYSLWREKTIRKYNFQIHPELSQNHLIKDTPQE